MSRGGLTSRKAAPVTQSRAVRTTSYGRFRDWTLTQLASNLARTRRALWYVEAMALSARYLQWLEGATWAAGSRRYNDRIALWTHALEPRLRDVPTAALEFGVADGAATLWWAARHVNFVEWHGFDTFAGLPTEWTRADVPVMVRGAFKPLVAAGGAPLFELPYPSAWHVGLIEHTLPAFERPDARLLVFIDVDLRAPAQTILDWLRVHGRPGDLVYFDEAEDPWNEGLVIRHALEVGPRFRAVAHTAMALVIELV